VALSSGETVGRRVRVAVGWSVLVGRSVAVEIGLGCIVAVATMGACARRVGTRVDDGTRVAVGGAAVGVGGAIEITPILGFSVRIAWS
jgi:hypothetical protein